MQTRDGKRTLVPALCYTAPQKNPSFACAERYK